MLSGESAVGKYPVEAVAMMARIVIDAELHSRKAEFTERRKERAKPSLHRRNHL